MRETPENMNSRLHKRTKGRQNNPEKKIQCGSPHLISRYSMIFAGYTHTHTNGIEWRTQIKLYITTGTFFFFLTNVVKK